MANKQVGNLVYIDSTTPKITGTSIRLMHLTVTATSATSVLTLKDALVGGTLLDVRIAATGTSQVFNYSMAPLVFPNGIEASTVTNCVATAVIQKGND